MCSECLPGVLTSGDEVFPAEDAANACCDSPTHLSQGIIRSTDPEEDDEEDLWHLARPCRPAAGLLYSADREPYLAYRVTARMSSVPQAQWSYVHLRGSCLRVSDALPSHVHEIAMPEISEMWLYQLRRGRHCRTRSWFGYEAGASSAVVVSRAGWTSTAGQPFMLDDDGYDQKLYLEPEVICCTGTRPYPVEHALDMMSRPRIIYTQQSEITELMDSRRRETDGDYRLLENKGLSGTETEPEVPEVASSSLDTGVMLPLLPPLSVTSAQLQAMIDEGCLFCVGSTATTRIWPRIGHTSGNRGKEGCRVGLGTRSGLRRWKPFFKFVVLRISNCSVGESSEVCPLVLLWERLLTCGILTSWTVIQLMVGICNDVVLDYTTCTNCMNMMLGHMWQGMLESACHFRKDCPQWKNKNQGNGNGVARAYAVGVVGQNPDNNVVTGTFLLNNRCASILFDTGADRSFVSTQFSTLINIAPTTLDHGYNVELADGRIIWVNTVLLGCTLNFLNHPFHVDLMPVEMGNYDVIIGMDRLTKYQAVIDCAKKIIRIPFGSEILIFHGDGSRNKCGTLTRLNSLL
ncbi:putative reverse transcriptase domain-containing protein [Tanacetum coccineum]